MHRWLLPTILCSAEAQHVLDWRSQDTSLTCQAASLLESDPYTPVIAVTIGVYFGSHRIVNATDTSVLQARKSVTNKHNPNGHFALIGHSRLIRPQQAPRFALFGHPRLSHPLQVPSPPCLRQISHQQAQPRRPLRPHQPLPPPTPPTSTSLCPLRPPPSLTPSHQRAQPLRPASPASTSTTSSTYLPTCITYIYVNYTTRSPLLPVTTGARLHCHDLPPTTLNAPAHLHHPHLRQLHDPAAPTPTRHWPSTSPP